MFLSFKTFCVSVSIKLTIWVNSSLLKESNTTISSTLFKNSGLNVSFKLSKTLFLAYVLVPKPIEFMFWLEPAFDVIIIIVFSKLTVLPWASVSLPSSNTCSKILNTSLWAFSISSNKTIEYGCLLTFSVNCPASS